MNDGYRNWRTTIFSMTLVRTGVTDIGRCAAKVMSSLHIFKTVKFFSILFVYVDHMNPLFLCDHGAATHSCVMHDTGRGTLCKNATRV